jgi:choice-of-anchor C domain-containing protein
MRLTNLAGVVAVGVSSAYGAVGQPNLLQNGGFEVGPGQADCTWVVHGVSPEFVPGWSVIAVSVDRERLSSSCPATTESWTSFDGEFTIDLDGGDAGGAIAQTVTTVPGRHYRLSFQLTGNCAPGTKSMRVEVAGVTAQFDHVCQSQNPQPWSEKSVDFVAIGKITTVVLRSLSTSGRNGPVIDAVQLVEVVDTCPADVDESGAVNGVDLAAVLNNWGTNGGKYPRADINGDGVVNASDLAAVLGAWGPCP